MSENIKNTAGSMASCVRISRARTPQARRKLSPMI